MRKSFFTFSIGIRLLLLLPLVALAGFCVFYLWGNYESLASWYESLGGPFFRQATWRKEFFTPQVWQTGRLFCVLSLLAIPFLALVVWKAKLPPKRRILRADALNSSLIAGVSILLGISNAFLARLSIDEYQSAFFMGGAHPFRALTHYPVPNNHVLFNTLNAFIATPGTALIWGKLISILAYAGVGVLIYLWFLELGVKRQAATVLALLTLVIFPVWGFSGQARGYTIYLLAYCWTLLLATRYLKSNDPSQLFWFPVALVVGYGALPTFIYFHLALLLWILFLGISRKKTYRAFWIAQTMGSLAAALFYVPLLSFSGIKAFSGHRWVAQFAWHDFSFPPLGPFRDYLTGYGTVGYLLGILTLLLSLRLLFSKKSRWIGALFAAIWVGCNLVVLLMRQPSFSRQLNGLYAVSVAIALWSIWLLLQKAAVAYPGKGILKIAAVAGVTIAAGVLAINRERLNDALYLYKIRETELRIQAFLSHIPAGEKVDFTDDAFHAQALWERNKEKVFMPEDARYQVQLEGADSRR